MPRLTQAWNDSYLRGDNVLFEPNEHLVRFISNWVVKRTSIVDRQFRGDFVEGSRALDLGCGIGRHLVYLRSVGLQPFGVDLSPVAVAGARNNFATSVGEELDESRVVACSAEALPWPDEFFDLAVSHGVLDSMRFVEAINTMQELARVVRPGGLIYLDLIHGDDGIHGREFNGEEVVTGVHERGTVQSYFNWAKIEKLTDSYFTIASATLETVENVLQWSKGSRWHLVLSRL